MKKIQTSEFVKKRHTVESEFTHFVGSWEDLEKIVTIELDKNNIEQGYRDGVIIIPLKGDIAQRFKTHTDFPMFEGMKLSAQYRKITGRESEPSQVCVKIEEPKLKCKYVDIVLYRADVLEEDNDRSSNAEWEIVSINGRLQKEPHCMDPLTIVRNWKHLPGGTEMKGATEKDVLEMLCDSILEKNNLKNKNE